ncbi:MAG: hypothetical protein PHO66_00640, partial [Eubacteriales bacterium]|nr:hypothetical protein [Eubacteriales bacterium]
MIKPKKLLFYAKKATGILLREGPFTMLRRVGYKLTAVRQNQAFRTFHLPNDQDLARQRAHKFDRDVLFSVLTPLYNTPETFLRSMIASVQSQTYPHWELCLADG